MELDGMSVGASALARAGNRFKDSEV